MSDNDHNIADIACYHSDDSVHRTLLSNAMAMTMQGPERDQGGSREGLGRDQVNHNIAAHSHSCK